MNSFMKFLIAVVCTILCIALLVGFGVWMYNDANAMGWVFSFMVAGMGSAIAMGFIGFFLTIFLQGFDDPKVNTYKTIFLVVLGVIAAIVLSIIIGPIPL